MRALSFIIAAAALAAAPLALAQTEPPATDTAVQAAPVYTPIEPADPIEPTAPAEAPAAAAEEPAVEASAPEPELICRTLVMRTESRLRSARERVCRTQAAWDEFDAQNARNRNGRAGPDNN
jgi:hypothetical protein